MKTEKFNIGGMTCAACQANVEKCVRKLDGTKEAEVSLISNQLKITYDENLLDENKIANAINEIGYTVNNGNQENADKSDKKSDFEKRKELSLKEIKSMKNRLISSCILLIILMYIAMGSMLSLPMPSILTGVENSLINALLQLLLTVPIIIINKHFFVNGFKALVKKSPNMDTLVAIGSSASFLYGLFSMFKIAYGFGHQNFEIAHSFSHELYFESSAMILTLVTVGKYLESKSKLKTTDSIEKLMNLAPKTANIIENGKEKTILADDLKKGDIIIVKPGEKIAVDGTIIEGTGYIDQSSITGESIPVQKNVGEEVISATINKNGSFKYKASKVGEETTLSQIVKLIEDAGNSKAPIARIADKVSAVFVPIVLAISLITAIIWLAAGQSFEFALSNAIAVLVISCPCALGLATPVAIMVGTGKAAENGILIKSAEALEVLHKADTIVLDKTGTITKGEPEVTDIIVLDKKLDENKFLKICASAEKLSEHPIADAIVKKAKSLNLETYTAEDFSAEIGLGINAKINKKSVIAGNEKFLNSNNIQINDKEKIISNLTKDGKTPVFFAIDNKLSGIVAVSDTIKDSSVEAIKKFKKLGLNVIMLTGDNKDTANAVKNRLEIDEVIAEVFPKDKEQKISQLKQNGKTVVMVGDGINDAPALMQANVGIAIGKGTDIAIDCADIVLLKNTLDDVVTAIELSKKVMKNIKMNLFWAFFYNILGIPVAAGILYPAFAIRLSPMIGSAAMSLSSVCVVTNALRLKFFKTKNSINNEKTDETKGKIIMKKTFKVNGMMCEHCKANVEKALNTIQSIKETEIDLESKNVTISSECEIGNDEIKEVIENAGYSVEF